MYRKIKVSDRKPEVEKVVIGLWDADLTASRAVVLQEAGYWNEAHEGYECDQPDYWLEEIEKL